VAECGIVPYKNERAVIYNLRKPTKEQKL
jgi:hypothetical protein